MFYFDSPKQSRRLAGPELQIVQLEATERKRKFIGSLAKCSMSTKTEMLIYSVTIQGQKRVTRKSHPPNWFQVFSIIFNQLIEGRVTSWVVRCLMKVNLIHMLIYTRWWVGTVCFKEETHISLIVTLRVRLKMTKINSQVNNSHPFWPMNPCRNLKNYTGTRSKKRKMLE